MLRRGLVVVVILSACLVASATSGAAGPLRTGFIDTQIFNGGANEPYAAAANAGATTVRLYLNWRHIAPVGSTKPPDFDPADSFDEHYNEAGWLNFDARVKAAKANGLQPIVFISNAPDWAQGAGNGPAGTRRPIPAEFGAVARAAAIRYSEEIEDPQTPGTVLPRVRFWQAWNEPNRNYFLSPQGTPAKPIAPAWYRAMLAHFALNVRGVQAELGLDGRNIVIAGGLAPFGHKGHLAPFTFMEKLLCMSAKRPARKVCNASKASFDIWAHHPYTCGGPTQQARARKDASLGDMAEMRAVLRAAAARGRIRATQRVGLWVTEISWDTKPPDSKAVPSALHARWVSEMLYRLWRLDIGFVTWFQLQDLPRPSPHQSGLHLQNGAKKLSHTAFRFPFVAFVTGSKVRVWGRTPPQAPAQTVVIERRTPSTGWRRVATTRSQSTGIFTRLVTMTRVGSLRARVTLPGAAASVPFALKRPKNPRICPFGS